MSNLDHLQNIEAAPDDFMALCDALDALEDLANGENDGNH